MDETRQQIGDVLVSTQVQDYELGRLNNDGTITLRGDRPRASDAICNRLRQTHAIQARQQGWPTVRFGLLLSGQKLVDNLSCRNSLKTLFPEAIGGEMEATGLYASATTAKVDWIVVKAICDWGHEKKEHDPDEAQKLAATNATRVLKSALDVGSIFADDHAVATPRRWLRAAAAVVSILFAVAMLALDDGSSMSFRYWLTSTI
jgi:nucleoside phosphorylase